MKFLPKGSVVLYVPSGCDYRSGIECITELHFLPNRDYAREVDWAHIEKYKHYNCGAFVASKNGGFHIYFQSRDMRIRG